MWVEGKFDTSMKSQVIQTQYIFFHLIGQPYFQIEKVTHLYCNNQGTAALATVTQLWQLLITMYAMFYQPSQHLPLYCINC